MTKEKRFDNIVEFSIRLDREKLPKRLWSMTDYEDRLKTSHHEHFLFRLISYNILAQRLIEDNPFLYENCQEHHLFWNRRRDRLFNEILDQNADVTKTNELKLLTRFFVFRSSVFKKCNMSIIVVISDH